jgi:8-oxo-dGTP diphosphatase
MRPKTPALTVDIIIETMQEGHKGIVLIARKHMPFGWAIPGGFVDYGETVEKAAQREALEETSLQVELIKLLGVYSDPARDIRQHTVSVVYVGKGTGKLKAGDDAMDASVFTKQTLRAQIAFDHRKILEDYFNKK